MYTILIHDVYELVIFYRNSFFCYVLTLRLKMIRHNKRKNMPGFYTINYSRFISEDSTTKIKEKIFKKVMRLNTY